MKCEELSPRNILTLLSLCFSISYSALQLQNMCRKWNAPNEQRNLQASTAWFHEEDIHHLPNNRSDGGKLGKERSNMDKEPNS